MGVPAVPTRLLTVNLPRLLSDLVGGLMASVDDLAIVEDVSAEHALAAIDALAPDAIVLCADDGDIARTTFCRLRASSPAMRIVELDAMGRTAIMHDPGAAPRVVADVSPEALLDMLLGPGN